ncbi:MAG: ATP-binding cassette domain-containing protein [Actinomycetota bacterium]|nr:ATP-binding cassette domain-containing protein [Actinomycetota bacterium]
MGVTWQFIIAGLSGGGAYALTGLGVVTIFRSSGVLSFAQGAIGMAGAYVFWEIQSGWGAPAYIAVVSGVFFGGLLSAAFYYLAVRRLNRASDLARAICTLGLLLLLQSLAVWHYGAGIVVVSSLFGSSTHTVFGATITTDTIVLLVVTLAVAALLVVLFKRTRFGSVAQALRERPDVASTVGISPHVVGVFGWTLGGALAAVAGILVLPTTGLAPSNATQLLLPAMGAGLISGFTSIWGTVGVGLAIGVVESLMVQHNVWAGFVNSVPFLVIVVALMLGGSALPGRGALEATRLPALTSGRVPWTRFVPLVVISVLVPIVFGEGAAIAVITSAIAVLLALSVVVITGYAGQISLAPFALAGVGSLVSAQFASKIGWPFLPSIFAGVLASVVVGILIGVPALRVRGVNLAIATLGLSLLIEQAVLGAPVLTGGTAGLVVPPASIFGFQITPSLYPSRFAIACILVAALAALVTMNIRRGTSGRRFTAVRANERGAAALGISVRGAKLGAFAISSGLAGLAGALNTFRFGVVGFADYTVFNSIYLVALVVVAGIGYQSGAIFAALISTGALLPYVIDQVVHVNKLDTWVTILAGVFVIDAVVRYPDGAIVSQARSLASLRRNLLSRANSRLSVRAEPTSADLSEKAREHLVVRPPERLRGVEATPSISDGIAVPVLEARGIEVRYGSTKALKSINLTLRPGEVTAVIGPNGAGKTSLIDAITGFHHPSAGTVTLRGADVTRWSAHKRARRGIGRTFQGLELFEDLTVRENILAAADHHRWDLLPYVTDLLVPKRQALSAQVDETVVWLGLAGTLDVRVSELPQGMRRMVAIARVMAQSPSVICLDEPAAGLSTLEGELIVATIRDMAHRGGVAVLLVEHDVDLVSKVADNVVVLDFGSLIAEGLPEHVLADPAVVEAYLGGSTAHVALTESVEAQ